MIFTHCKYFHYDSTNKIFLETTTDMNLQPLLDHGWLLLSTEHHALCEKLQSLGSNTLRMSDEGEATLLHGQW